MSSELLNTTTWYISETEKAEIYKKKLDFFNNMPSSPRFALPNFRIYEKENKFWIYFGKKEPRLPWMERVQPDTYLLNGCDKIENDTYVKFNINNKIQLIDQIIDGMTIRIPSVVGATESSRIRILSIKHNPSIRGKRDKKNKKKPKKKTKRQKKKRKSMNKKNKSKKRNKSNKKNKSKKRNKSNKKNKK